MTQLTKTQINYFREKLAAAVNLRKKSMLEESKRMLPEIDITEEKLKAIIRGEVELKIDELQKTDRLGGALRVYLDDVYPDPKNVCEYKKREEELRSRIARIGYPVHSYQGTWPAALDSHADSLLDRFVLGEVNTENVLDEIAAITTWKPTNYWPILIPE